MPRDYQKLLGPYLFVPARGLPQTMMLKWIGMDTKVRKLICGEYTPQRECHFHITGQLVPAKKIQLPGHGALSVPDPDARYIWQVERSERGHVGVITPDGDHDYMPTRVWYEPEPFNENLYDRIRGNVFFCSSEWEPLQPGALAWIRKTLLKPLP